MGNLMMLGKPFGCGIKSRKKILMSTKSLAHLGFLFITNESNIVLYCITKLRRLIIFSNLIL